MAGVARDGDRCDFEPARRLLRRRRSIIRLTSATEFAGKPPRLACSRTTASLGARTRSRSCASRALHPLDLRPWRSERRRTSGRWREVGATGCPRPESPFDDVLRHVSPSWRRSAPVAPAGSIFLEMACHAKTEIRSRLRPAGAGAAAGGQRWSTKISLPVSNPRAAAFAVRDSFRESGTSGDLASIQR